MGDVVIFADSLDPNGQTTEQSYTYGPGATYPVPILIDAANEECAAYTSTTAIWSYQGALYKLLVGLTPHQAVICKSLDSGATWIVLDTGNGPLSIRIGPSLDEAAGIVYCAFRNEGNNRVNLINFDLVTETWGAVYGTLGPVMVAGVSAWKRPDDTILVAYQGIIGSGADAAVFDLTSGTWAAAFDAGANITTLPAYDGNQTSVDMLRCTAVMEDTGRVHLFFQTISLQAGPPFWGGRVFYQAIELDDSLGAFFDFPGQSTLTAGTQDLVAFSGVPMGRPVLVNGFIVLPVLQTNRNSDPFPHQLANVYLGAPIDNPVWSTTMGDTIDPGALIDDFIWPQDTPFASFDGTTIYVVLSCQDEDGQNFARLRLCQTLNLANPALGWSAFTAFDLQVDAPPGFNFATQELTLASVFAPAPAPVPASAPFRVALYGYKRFKDRPVCAPDLVELPHVPGPARVL